VGLIIPGLALSPLADYLYLRSALDAGVWRMRGLTWDFLVNSIYYSPLASTEDR